MYDLQQIMDKQQKLIATQRQLIEAMRNNRLLMIKLHQTHLDTMLHMLTIMDRESPSNKIRSELSSTKRTVEKWLKDLVSVGE